METEKKNYTKLLEEEFGQDKDAMELIKEMREQGMKDGTIYETMTSFY